MTCNGEGDSSKSHCRGGTRHCIAGHRGRNPALEEGEEEAEDTERTSKEARKPNKT